jgi:hypothetical protein
MRDPLFRPTQTSPHRVAVVFLPMLSPTPPPVSPPEAEAENALVATAILAIVPFSSADSASTPPSCCRRGRECAECASTSLEVVTGRWGGSRAGGGGGARDRRGGERMGASRSTSQRPGLGRPKWRSPTASRHSRRLEGGARASEDGRGARTGATMEGGQVVWERMEEECSTVTTMEGGGTEGR